MVCIVKHLLWLHGVNIVHVRVGIFACVCVCVCVCVVHMCVCMCVIMHMDRFREKGPNAWFFKISNFWIFKSLKCPLHIASYALRIGVSVVESEGSELLINASITFLLRVLEIL